LYRKSRRTCLQSSAATQSQLRIPRVPPIRTSYKSGVYIGLSRCAWSLFCIWRIQIGNEFQAERDRWSMFSAAAMLSFGNDASANSKISSLIMLHINEVRENKLVRNSPAVFHPLSSSFPNSTSSWSGGKRNCAKLMSRGSCIAQYLRGSRGGRPVCSSIT